MSLESKIETLTLAVEALTEIIKTMKPAPERTVAPVKVEKVKPTSEPAPAPAPVLSDVISVESIQSLCLEKVRADRDNTVKVKAILDNRLVKNIPATELPAIKSQLEQL